MTRALLDLADALGLTIEYYPLARRNGEYRHDLRRIRLRDGMTIRQERSTLAHELAHAVFADVPSPYGPVTAKQERRADEWAALRLITTDAYRAAEERWNGHLGAIAYDLAVTSRLVKAYQGLLLRLGPATYVEPRMGAGQWQERILA
ncbi:ImmA/IrrE family metallo-endopeptidase [Microbacterium resistens]|uniref:ImmA/IrrE family metallo-endopeptidase n=1 Tax=Microbacterium resistens TaxID=156977 RepID=UPI001C575AAC|nr:ImmA/IrrE family metallo-endopeptidase [Microbacterium resistens]MBW1639287.1 ImmA/IrrE family metallo-endopeptidase [Microbacterium resistens]